MSPVRLQLLGQDAILSDLIFVVLALVTTGLAVLGRLHIVIGSFEIVLGSYLIAMLVSAAASEDPETSFKKFLGVAYLVAVAVLTKTILVTTMGVRSAVSAWLLAAAVTVVVSVLGCLLFYSGLPPRLNPFQSHYGSLPPGEYPRIKALFLNVNMCCNYLIVSAALAYWWTQSPRRRLPAILSVGIWIAALSTFSTGIGGLALVTALLVRRLVVSRQAGILPQLAHPLVPLSALLALFLLVAASLSPAIVTEGVLAPSMRLQTWRGSLDTFLSHPLLGKGLGLPVTETAYVNLSGHTQIFTDAHNIWLNIAAQAGVLGLATLLAVLIHALRAGPRGSNKGELAQSLPERISLPLALKTALVGAWLYHGLTGSFEDTRHLWVLLGLLEAAKRAGSSGGTK